MSDIEFLGPPTALTTTPPATASATSASLSQRRTSNFFPSSSNSSSALEEFTSSSDGLFAISRKSQLNSPIINVMPHLQTRPYTAPSASTSTTSSVHNNNNNNNGANGNSSSKFFSNDPMTPFSSSTTSLNTTPTVENNLPLNHGSNTTTRLTQSSIALFGGIDFEQDLSKDMTNFLSSPPPQIQSSPFYYQQQQHSSTVTASRLAGPLSSPPQQARSSSTSALGTALPSSNNSANTTTQSTPIANPWSIWNESPFGGSGKPTSGNGNTPVMFDPTLTPKLSTLQEYSNRPPQLVFSDVAVEDDDDDVDVSDVKYPSDLLFSPFLGDQNHSFHNHNQFPPPPLPSHYSDLQYQSNTNSTIHSTNNGSSSNYHGSNRTNSMSSTGTIKPKRENIYVNKMNIPTFIPSSASASASASASLTTPYSPLPNVSVSMPVSIEMTQSERNLEDMRQFISRPRSNVDESEEVFSDSYLEANDENSLQLKLDKLIRREEDIFRNSNNNSVANNYNNSNNNNSNNGGKKAHNCGNGQAYEGQPVTSSFTTSSPHVSLNPTIVNRATVKLNLPKHYNIGKEQDEEAKVPFNDKLFINDILLSKVSNKYAEDYASTFYKRNSHGYMFIKEPTTTLKVNSTGNKSWVQLKIKLPPLTTDENLTPSADTALVAKKLKVDIRQLPLWRPINLNASSSSSTSSGSSSSSASSTYDSNLLYGGSKRVDHNSGNGNGNGTFISTNKKHDFRKPKNLNVSKRFGKRNSE